MRIDSGSNVDAFTKLADTSGKVSTEVAVSLTKQVMDSAKDQMAQLLSSMQPHLGQQVDMRL
jgi:hypothetical protein